MVLWLWFLSDVNAGRIICLFIYKLTQDFMTYRISRPILIQDRILKTNSKTRRISRTYSKFRPIKYIDRASVARAFSGKQRSAEQVEDLVKKYMGDSPVPPRWGRGGVKAEFGNEILRLWSRHLKNRYHPAYRSENGRWLHPAIQHLADFGIPSGMSREIPNNSSFPLIFDENCQYMTDGIRNILSLTSSFQSITHH